MRNQRFAYAKAKAEISIAVTAKLIRVFVFATRIVKLAISCFQLLAISCACTARFVSKLFKYK